MKITATGFSCMYCPDDGEFYNTSGEVITTKKAKGYRSVYCNKKSYYAHRLAVFFMLGRWPKEDVDHVNGIRHDNRWSNLREASRSENLMNRVPNKNKDRSLPKNVYRHLNTDRLKVKMKIKGRTEHFGYYQDLELAELVAEEVQRKYHGAFAPTSREDV